MNTVEAMMSLLLSAALVLLQSSAPAPNTGTGITGVRISGFAMTASGRPAAGKTVRLFHQLGSEGSESPVGVVGPDGAFETPPLPPGWYRLTIGTPAADSQDEPGEFATTLVEVRDRALDGLSLVRGRRRARFGPRRRRGWRGQSFGGRDAHQRIPRRRALCDATSDLGAGCPGRVVPHDRPVGFLPVHRQR